VVVGADGRVFVADYNNHAIRAVTPEGDVSTLVHQDGFERPFGLALARDGRTLYVETDRDDHKQQTPMSGTIWRVDVASGAATVLARDIGRPRGLAVAADGSLLLADNQHHTIRVMNTQTGALSVLAGVMDLPGNTDATGVAARFDEPYDLVVDAAGDILVADLGNNVIRKLTPAGVVTTFAGTGAAGWKDGPANQATFQHPQGLAIDGLGNVYVTDTDNFCIRRIDPSGNVTTVAGNRQPGFRDGAPRDSQLFGIEGLDVTLDGMFLYVADGNRGADGPYNRVRRVMLE
jgi:DNA-binding beta-propeller fold protein YncE